MLKRIPILAVGMAVLLLALGPGCQNKPNPVQEDTPLPPAQTAPAPQAKAPSPPPAQTPLKDALEEHFAASGAKGSHSAIPAGTRLLSVKLEDGVASVDVSKEFNALANQGESSESQAQKELRTLLAQFPAVQKMRLTVAGKPFDSQATDWSTPFPVRDNDLPGATHNDGPDHDRNSR